MIISLLVAASENNCIGKNNQLPWHLPNDLKFFKNLTWGMPVLMGRKTFESVNKPLPGRFNIVITRQVEWNTQGIIKATSLEDAIEKAKQTNCREAYVIGGGEIFQLALPMATTVYLTRVHAVINGDVFFPELDPQQWELSKQSDHPADEKHAYPYSFQTWIRK